MPALVKLEELGVIVSHKTRGSWTQYDLQAGTESGTSQSATSPKNGTTKPVPKAVPAEAKAVPKAVPVVKNQSQKRDTNHKTLKDKNNIRPEYLSFSSQMWERIKPITKQARQPNLDAWAGDIRKLVEIDQRDIEIVSTVFCWANTHHFWQAQILCPATLRRQFNKLFAQMGREGANATTRPNRNPATPGRKLTPAQRTEAKREQLRQQSRSPDLGVVATNGGDIRPPVGLPAGGRAE